ncbi:MAG: hypothetical protein ABMB14_03830 [Myxococcota bacterium]
MNDLARAMAKLLDAPTGRFSEFAEDLALDIPALRARLEAIGDEADLADFFPAEIEPHYTLSGQCALIAKLVREAGHPLGAPTVIVGDHCVDDRMIVVGDLVVEGRLEVAGQLVVLGDVDAHGYRDKYSATSIGGDLRVTGAICTRGMLSVAGHTRASFVCLDYNQGFAKLLGGCHATALIEADHGGSRIFGTVEVRFLRRDELMLDEDLDDSPAALLSELLSDDVRAQVMEKADGWDLGATVCERFDEGARVFG